MKSVVQRVSRASVSVDGRTVAEIGPGLLVLAGFGKQDSTDDLEWMLRKILGLRIFPDAEGVMNLSLEETRGSLLLVSQFTLHADSRKGKRPSYIRAALSEDAAMLYALFVEMASHSGLPVAAGVFGSMMDVTLVNRGPVTILLDSPSESVS
jgi:D-aminoacyl-tRNA deacylase